MINLISICDRVGGKPGLYLTARVSSLTEFTNSGVLKRLHEPVCISSQNMQEQVDKQLLNIAYRRHLAAAAC